jgi:hypothetical protein
VSGSSVDSRAEPPSRILLPHLCFDTLEEQTEEDQALESTAIARANEEWVGKQTIGPEYLLHQ